MDKPQADAPVDIVSLFKSAAFEVGGIQLPEKLSLDTELSKLGMSSVTLMETIGFFEERLEIRFNDDELSRLTTLRDLEKLVHKASHK